MKYPNKTLLVFFFIINYCIANATVVQVGTLGNSSVGTDITPYKAFYEDGRSQYLVLASEIIAGGGSAGVILDLSYYVSTPQNSLLSGFTIKLGATILDSLTNNFQPNGGFTICYSQNVPITTNGWNTYSFSTPFIWNGTDNIIIETCFDNILFGYNSPVHFNNLSFKSNTYSYADFSSGCILNAMSVNKKRPVMKFNIISNQVNDAGITSLDIPNIPICNLANIPLTITLENMGSDTLKNVIIEYWINSVPQTPYNWIGNISPYKNIQGVVIANVTFNDNDTLIIKTSMPNGLIDVYNTNDSITFFVKKGLSGNYTIGNLGDYATISSAVSDLKVRGVCNSITFLIDNTTFNEQIVLEKVAGMNKTNTVTLKGTGNNSKLTFNSIDSIGNYVVKFNNGSFYKLDSLIIENTGTAFSCVIELINGCRNNEVKNCILIGDTNSSSTSTLNAVISGKNSALNKLNVFKNNSIYGGSYGLIFNGLNSFSLADSNIFEGNTFYKQYFIQSSFTFNSNLKFLNNNMNMLTSNTGTTYQLYLNSCMENIEVAKNILSINKAMGQHYSIYTSQCDAQNKKGLFVNNFISSSNINNSTLIYGFYSNGSKSLYLVNNNFNIASNNNNSCALYISYGSNNSIISNNVIITNKGYGIYNIGVQSIYSCNYNNIYTPLGLIGYYNNLPYVSLYSWQFITGYDLNSISIDPLYKDSFDLHSCAKELVGSGKSINYITDDIDGQTRNNNKPYIGADVFMDLSNLLPSNILKCPLDTFEINIIADPNEALTYNWLPNGETTPTINAIDSGLYFLTITTQCGSASDSIRVKIDTTISIANFQFNTSFLVVEFINNSTNSTNYFWDFGDGSTSTIANPIYGYINPGSYTVQLIACNNCVCDTTEQIVTVIANSINESNSISSVNIYPNPAGDFIMYRTDISDNENAMLVIYNMLGEALHTEKINVQQQEGRIDLSEFVSGMYLYKVYINNAPVRAGPFVISK